MAVNLTKNQDEITGAWRQVVDSKTTQKWALFGYEGNSNNIKLMSTGDGGLKELVQEFNCSMIQYAFCRVIVDDMNLNKLILINWQGDSSPLSRKGLCASHVGDVVGYFKGCSQTITIRNDDEATEEYLMSQILKTLSSSRISLPRQQPQQIQPTSHVKTNESADSSSGSSSIIVKKLDINSELALDRKSFWQRQEEEEKERLLEEKKRAAEKQAQFERERKLREESEAKKLAETIKERDRIIEATRQAERRESSSGCSQPSSILTTNANEDNEDERVGRRSELIRLERNQETLSLIGKGLIKNKRAIFEQASQQQQNHPAYNSNTTRRGSGTMVSQRLNTFKSLDHSGSTSSNASVEKLANGFSKQVNMDENQDSTIKKEVETVRIANKEVKHEDITPTVNSPVLDTPVILADTPQNLPVTDTNCIDQPSPKISQPTTTDEQNVITANADVDANGNDSSDQFYMNAKPDPELEEILKSKKYGTKAKALYDYQAADTTEISFDPDDIIGCIEKVDAGWWHGTVVTGTYKGVCGLFPANHVEELN